jgi:hypothetical protein
MIPLPLVGPPYPSRSLAAAASELTNLIIETAESNPDQAKNTAFLFGSPGKHLFKDLDFAHSNIRGLWSGGGRLFVAQGLDLVEVDVNGTVVSRTTYTAVDDGNPVQILGNSNQLLIVSAGQAYVADGVSIVACRFQLNGTVTTAGAGAVIWASGDKFTAAMVGREITIAGQELLVASFTNDTHITLTTTFAGAGAGFVTTFLDLIFWVSGDKFTDSMKGMVITIAGVNYTILSVPSGSYLILDVPDGSPGAGQQTNVAYAVTQTNLTYNCAGGDLVTAVTAAFFGEAAYVQRPSGGTPDLGRQVNFSGVLDFTLWRGLDFKTKEGGIDYTRSIIVDGDMLGILGTETSEVWQLDTNTGQPVRVPGYTVKFGSISKWGPICIDGKVFFVGGDSQGGIIAYRVDSAIPTRISTHAEEAAWKAAGLGVNCISYSYTEEGHVFWCINFGSQTWCWDETEKRWGRRMSWTGSAFAGDSTFYHTYIPEWGNGKHITAGDLLTGYVYESSVNFYDDNGADRAWRRAIPYRYNQGNLIYSGFMELEMETGTVASGAAPTITRDYSDDRGKTFANSGTASIGVHDDTSLRVTWPYPAGSSRGRVWRFFGSGQSKVALIALQGEETLGTC